MSEPMSDGTDASTFFNEIMASEVVPITCGRCGSETVVNKRYLPYLRGNTIADCQHCRNQKP
jgi:hypothetical protein